MPTSSLLLKLFRVFWPILTYLRRGLLRPGSTILSYPKLIVMEKTIAALALGHVVRECNWSGENNGTGSRAQEVLQLSLCLLRRLRRGPCDTVLKYERTIMCTLLYNSKWHQDLPGQAHSGEFEEGMLSKLVRDKARNRGSVTVEEV